MKTEKKDIVRQNNKTQKKFKYINLLAYKRQSWEIEQQELANKLGVSRQTISAIETNKKQPSLFLAVKIADFFHTTVEDIFRFRP